MTSVQEAKAKIAALQMQVEAQENAVATQIGHVEELRALLEQLLSGTSSDAAAELQSSFLNAVAELGIARSALQSAQEKLSTTASQL